MNVCVMKCHERVRADWKPDNKDAANKWVANIVEEYEHGEAAAEALRKERFYALEDDEWEVERQGYFGPRADKRGREVPSLLDPDNDSDTLEAFASDGGLSWGVDVPELDMRVKMMAGDKSGYVSKMIEDDEAFESPHIAVWLARTLSKKLRTPFEYSPRNGDDALTAKASTYML